MKKHSVKISGHTTSISLEDEFWKELKKAAVRNRISLSTLISEIDEKRRPGDNLCSAIRVFILEEMKRQI